MKRFGWGGACAIVVIAAASGAPSSAAPIDDHLARAKVLARAFELSGEAERGAKAVRERLLLLDRLDVPPDQGSQEFHEKLRKAFREVAEQVTAKAFAERLGFKAALRMTTPEAELVLAFYESAAAKKLAAYSTDSVDGPEAVGEAWRKELFTLAMRRAARPQ